jgi:transposase
MQCKRKEFFRRHTGTNTKTLARELGLSISTIYNWLSSARKKSIKPLQSAKILSTTEKNSIRRIS